MIVGVGTDMIEISRIEDSIQRFGDRFLDRIFTSGEIRYCQQKKKHAAESFAARFAAKEAGAKALGTGISRGISWKEIEVRRSPGARPTLHLSGRALEIAGQLGIGQLSLSLTHGRDLAFAVVVAEDGAA
ncbi:holo-ACP synthase [Edaphobacter sp. HDX4]|uniref:holo-ACP synthase n=1 Tax=Edaphobacter sp. HDX4 TaxID=2794064 RepID=UPI002FE64B17